MSEKQYLSTSGERLQPPPISPKNLLLVEDYDRLRAMMAKPFERAGFTVYSASSPLDVLTLAKSMSPQIVIVDQSLSSTSAMLLLRLLRAQLPESLVIVYGSHGTVTDLRDDALQNGANDVLMQGYDASALDSIVSQASVH